MPSDPRPRDDRQETPPAGCQAGALVSLIHTCYLVSDIDRSLAFYAALGFSESFRFSTLDGGLSVFMNLALDGSEPRLELAHHPGIRSDETGSGFGHVAITTVDLDAALVALARDGIEPEKPPRALREGGNRICFVRDPDGHRLELIERLVS